jgi:hypothetical protein
MFLIERFGKLHAVEFGHVDVKEDGINLLVVNDMLGLNGALALCHEFEVGNLLDIGFFYFAKLNGYAVEHPDFSKAHYVDEALDLVNHGYKISKGEQSRQLSIHELRDLENDICDYIGYRLDRYMEKGR